MDLKGERWHIYIYTTIILPYKLKMLISKLFIDRIQVLNVTRFSCNTVTSFSASVKKHSYQFAEVAAADFDHLALEAQAGDVVLEVELHAGLGRRGDVQPDGVTVDQPVLHVWGLGTIHWSRKEERRTRDNEQVQRSYCVM